VESEDPAQLRMAIQLLARDEAQRQALIRKAHQRLRDDELTSTGYARRHVELSRQLLDLAPQPVEPPKARQGINVF